MPPYVIAHRGASGHAYENSAAAFERAIALGADGVELDVHATRDHALLVHHDFEVPGIGPIADLPVAAFDAYRLPNGERIPTLEESLRILAGRRVWVELKTLPASADDHLLAALEQGPSPALYAVHAFDHRIVARLGDRRPELSRGVLLASYLLDILPAIGGTGADTLWMEARLIDGQLVRELHDVGVKLIAWTVNDDRAVRRLAALGVDGLCGNYPDRIRAALA
ncbi:MAG TPA: glycerophosphodiester phosphodiesterase [Gemmatimonadales bacterium]|nr:glycerophosphodiester phosphodiesterase [Gemmatimonadales bacterium]